MWSYVRVHIYIYSRRDVYICVYMYVVGAGTCTKSPPEGKFRAASHPSARRHENPLGAGGFVYIRIPAPLALSLCRRYIEEAAKNCPSPCIPAR